MLRSLSTFPASHRMGNFYFRKIVGDSNDHNRLPRLIHIHSSISYWLYLLLSSESRFSLVLLSLVYSVCFFLNFQMLIQATATASILLHTEKPLHNDLQVCFPDLPPPVTIFSSFSTCSIYGYSPSCPAHIFSCSPNHISGPPALPCNAHFSIQSSHPPPA